MQELDSQRGEGAYFREHGNSEFEHLAEQSLVCSSSGAFEPVQQVRNTF